VGNGILPAQAAPLAAVGPPPHLQAFGVPSQVSSASNIHTVVNHFGGSGPASFSFFDGLSSGLAPPIAGQEGPTLEQFLGRSLKNWKPFTSDADFKEALTDWLDRITQQLADGGDNSAALRAVVSYIMTTLGYVSEHGHQLVFKYHKAVMQAMRKSPPLYDPLINGPTYTQAFVEHLFSSASSGAGRRSSQSSSRRGGRRQSNPSRDAQSAKRKAADQSCAVHHGANHTNGECKAQQSNKRRASGTQAAAASGD
jgi:hypothetical protein